MSLYSRTIARIAYIALCPSWWERFLGLSIGTELEPGELEPLRPKQLNRFSTHHWDQSPRYFLLVLVNFIKRRLPLCHRIKDWKFGNYCIRISLIPQARVLVHIISDTFSPQGHRDKTLKQSSSLSSWVLLVSSVAAPSLRLRALASSEWHAGRAQSNRWQGDRDNGKRRAQGFASQGYRSKGKVCCIILAQCHTYISGRDQRV